MACGTMLVQYLSDIDPTASVAWMPTDGGWHSFEVHPDAVAQTMTVWLDGVQAYTGHALSSNGFAFSDFKFGLYQNNRSPADQHLYIDDICVSASRCP